MDFKKLLPHGIAILILLAVAALFFAPNAFSGKVLPQPDNDKARALQTEIQDYIKKEGKAPLWTNSAFAGMPAFQIYTETSNYTRPVAKSLFLWADYTTVWTQAFVAMLCMYILLLVLGLDWRVSIFGGLAFGITSYNIDIIEAGHSTKMAALALAPGVLAGLVMAFNGRWLFGGGLLALFMAMQVNCNHIQITYYTLLLAGIFFLAKLIDAIRKKDFVGWGRGIVVSGLAIALGFAANASRLWPTYEYGQETTRGRSELADKAAKGDGLDKNYLFGWSYGMGESMTLLVPHFAGGGANETYRNTETYKVMTRKYSQQIPREQAEQQVGGLMYTGKQPFLGTAIYFGAIVCFLFLLGALLAPGVVKWWLVAGAFFMVSLAWGNTFFLNDILYDYMPMFSKFRAVSMALGLGQLFFAALAALGLQALADSGIPLDKKKRALWISAGVTILAALLAIAFAPDAGQNDELLAQTPDLMDALQKDRASFVRSDAFRSIGFIVLAAALIWFYLQGRLKAGMMVGFVAALALADHWGICTRTIDSSNYENKKTAIAPPAEEEYDRKIKEDKDLFYRVMDYSRGKITTNWTTSYFHKSMSGYHAAKLQRFQEIVDRYLGDVYPKDEKYLPGILQITGLLNVKYVVKPNREVIPNPVAQGNAWFVKGYRTVANGDEELNGLSRLDLRDSIVVQQSYADALQGFTPQFDSTARIRLTAYHPDKMEYEYSAQTDQLAMFSEVYYPPAKGWKCFINGQPAADFIKADYFLRAMRLPAGQNMKLEMRFEPRSYYLGESISKIASLLALLLFFGGAFWWFRRHPWGNPANLSNVDRPVASPRPSVTQAPKAPVKGKKR